MFRSTCSDAIFFLASLHAKICIPTIKLMAISKTAEIEFFLRFFSSFLSILAAIWGRPFCDIEKGPMALKSRDVRLNFKPSKNILGLLEFWAGGDGHFCRECLIFIYIYILLNQVASCLKFKVTLMPLSTLSKKHSSSLPC